VETARPAAPSDLVELTRLWSEALADLEGLRGGAALADSLTRLALGEYLLDAIGSEDRLVVLGLIDQSPVGLASVRARRELARPIGDVELIYVEPAARRVGVAETMLALVAERCRDWGMHGIDAPALPGDRGAKSFFEDHGYTARLLVMHHPTDPGPQGEETGSR
jgi:GNAT superfamily N-acetyltransferase